jgi:hypothetical protein
MPGGTEDEMLTLDPARLDAARRSDDDGAMRFGAVLALLPIVLVAALHSACVGDEPAGSVDPVDAGTATPDSAPPVRDSGPPTADAATDGPTCEVGKTSCGADGCVDLKTSPDHCGACRAGCGVDTCVDGACPKRLVFVTAAAFDGNLGGLAGADAKCAQAATSGKLRGRYKAWLSAPGASNDALGRLEHAPVPYVLPSSAAVANDWNDLVDATIISAIHTTEEKKDVSSGARAWTATDPNGTVSNVHCLSWTSNAAGEIGRQGNASAISASWTNPSGAGELADACNRLNHLYCFEQR